MPRALVMGFLLFLVFSTPGNVLAINTPQALGIYTDSPVEFVLTDPQGRRTGFDPITKTSFQEIPASNYSAAVYCDEQNFSSCNPPFKSLDMANQMAGLYTLDVIGTGSGDFRVEVRASDVTGNWITHTYSDTTAPGRTSRFTFRGQVVFFASFEPNLKITAATKAFEMNGKFTLGPEGAISPVTQPVSVEMGNSFPITIPANSFQETPQGAFVFKGVIRGLTMCTTTAFNDSANCLYREVEPNRHFDANLTPIGGNAYAFKIMTMGLTDLPSANPIEVRLAVGNNGGNAEVNAHFSP